jgi:uncharacterized protein (TIGR00290 family)
MKVAILYSGGKDSTFAIDLAKSKGWDIRYLLSVKPTRTDCYLFHYATVEHTQHFAQMLGVRRVLKACDVADPALEAEIVKKAVLSEEPVDAVVLGGIGLQETQLRSIQKALLPHGIEVFAAHAGDDHVAVMKQMIAKGYKFMISQVAADGLDEHWLGRVLQSEKDVDALVACADRYGFHAGGEGGHYDTFTIDGPLFTHALDVKILEKRMETACSGHLIADVQPVQKAVHKLAA